MKGKEMTSSKFASISFSNLVSMVNWLFREPLALSVNNDSLQEQSLSSVLDLSLAIYQLFDAF